MRAVPKNSFLRFARAIRQKNVQHFCGYFDREDKAKQLILSGYRYKIIDRAEKDSLLKALKRWPNITIEHAASFVIMNLHIRRHLPL
ncbi:MAG: hypothetical protein V1838_01820 [Patescibacteria group bacterium]